MRSRKSLAAMGVLAVAAGMGAQAMAKPPEPQGNREFWVEYNTGLMAMREGRLGEAEAQFTQAIRRSPDPKVYLARAAALALQEKFERAIDDLSHANERVEGGGRPSREPQLWRTAIWAMSDIAPDGAEANGIGGGVFFSGIPGALVQGGDDYQTGYASQLAYELAMAYRDAKQKGGNVHSPELEAQRKKAAQWFANRKLATREMAPFTLQYARELLNKDKPAEALDAVALAKVVFPFDADIRLAEADVYRRLGRPESARKDYTIALTIQTDLGSAYRGRALCAAAEGDLQQTKEDLRLARQYDAKNLGDVEDTASKLLGDHPPVNVSPADLLKELDKAAANGATVEQLLPTASRLVRAAAAGSVRYDEMYQSRLRQLEDITRAKPRETAGWVAFAGCILDEIRNRGENVEPRRGTQYYRYQYSQAMEISRAQFALNKALEINPNDLGALVRMAYAYDDLGQSGNAEECINKVVAIAGPRDADAIRLLAEYRADQAGSMQAQAHDLRSPHFYSSSHTEDRSDGVYEVTVTTRVDPSSGDIQQANELDADARAKVAQAKQYMEAAMKSNPGSLEGLLLTASYQNWFATADEALATLQGAVKKFPDSLKAADMLTDFYVVHGMEDQAIDERMAASRMYQTTAGPLLERIWRDIHQNGWPALMGDLERARQANPADARSTYYLAAAQADAKDRAASEASLRVAIAIEKARLKLDDQREGVNEPRDAADMGLLIRLLGTAGVHAAQAGDTQAGLADISEALSLFDRFGPGGRGALMFSAMLPNPRDPALPVPSPVNGATLGAQSYVALGTVQEQAGERAEALKSYAAAAGLARPYKSNVPRVGNARGDTNFSEDASGPVVVVAFVDLAKADIAAGDFRAAGDALNNAGQNGADRTQLQEINQLQQQVAQRINGQMQQPYQAPGYPGGGYQQPGGYQPPAYDPSVQGQRQQFPLPYQPQRNQGR